MFKDIIPAFIPIFVAVDALGVIPIFISLTERLNGKDKSKIIVQSMVTAICLAIGFILLGKSIFRFLGITISDFMVAGGTILFCLAIKDIITPEKILHITPNGSGAVPLGTPLIVGPAVLTTSLIIIGEHGIYITLISVILNVLLAGLILAFSGVLIRVLGESGTKAFSKVTSLLLAAIAVMMIRKGIIEIITSV